MTSIRRQMKLAFVFPDGDGGFVLKASLPDGEVVELPLTAHECFRLADQCLKAGGDLLPKPPPKLG